jgi:hypothetical protein
MAGMHGETKAAPFMPLKQKRKRERNPGPIIPFKGIPSVT